MKIKILSKQKIYSDIANTIIDLISTKQNTILGLATGSSPIGVYDKLVEAFNTKKVSFRNVKTFNLDEYYPINDSNPQSYRYFMNRHLFNKVDIDKNNTHFPSANNYKEYDQLIASAGGIDFQILGIGSNGHIAFNEPGTSFDSLTHMVKLANSTINDNARFFNSIDEVPTQAVSMGLKSIMKAKRIALIATGANKAHAIKQLIEQEANINLPASVLKTHPDVVIYLDKEAASFIC